MWWGMLLVLVLVADWGIGTFYFSRWDHDSRIAFVDDRGINPERVADDWVLGKGAILPWFTYREFICDVSGDKVLGMTGFRKTWPRIRLY